MKIFYSCERCGNFIDMIEVEKVDEIKFGFDILTAEERQDIIKVDLIRNEMYVNSLCDECIESMEMNEDRSIQSAAKFLH